MISTKSVQIKHNMPITEAPAKALRIENLPYTARDARKVFFVKAGLAVAAAKNLAGAPVPIKIAE